MDEKTKTKITTILEKYLPLGTIDYLITLFEEHVVEFRIVAPRRNKHGDFRASPDHIPRITVNNNLNPYAFLVTTIHEFAHLVTWKQHGKKVKAHGIEWQDNFVQLMRPMIGKSILPNDIEEALEQSFCDVKASSCTDIELLRVLQKYDAPSTTNIALEKLPANAIFMLHDKMFKKEHLRRTRYMCTELETNKKYLIHKLAIVKQKEIPINQVP